jgi:hypothetical protein
MVQRIKIRHFYNYIKKKLEVDGSNSSTICAKIPLADDTPSPLPPTIDT